MLTQCNFSVPCIRFASGFGLFRSKTSKSESKDKDKKNEEKDKDKPPSSPSPIPQKSESSRVFRWGNKISLDFFEFEEEKYRTFEKKEKYKKFEKVFHTRVLKYETIRF